MSSSPSGGDSEPPIEEWLSQLGRSDSPGASQEARDISAMARRQRAEDASAVARAGLDHPAAEERALQQLRFRLRREGVDFRSGVQPRWWGVGAVAMLAVTVTFNLFKPDPADPWDTFDSEPPSFRGSGPVEQLSKDPRVDARALAQKLHSAGVTPLVYVQPDRVTVSFSLQPEQLADVERTALAPLRLAGARKGENQIVFIKARS